MRKTSKRPKEPTFEPRALPPAIEAAFQAVTKRLSKMSAHEIFLMAVETGIYTKNGKLRKPYAPQPDDHLAR